ncbi:odorant receptor Or1-like [Bradysia coprophila]|uniref:odorant receptor Or1-like n=1 Tax=Bradysia coprophila TaxID=38358 RepID=UPI00187D8C91|nr:odorant receptor Or1-like [Bradysia coprophila]
MFRKQINSIREILKSTEPMDSFKIQINVLRILGGFHDPDANKYFKHLTIFPIILILKLCTMSVIHLLSHSVSLEEKLQGSFTSNTSLLCCIKLYYMRKNSLKLFDLVKSLKHRINPVNEYEMKLMQKGAIYPTALSYILLQSAILFSCVIYAFFPIGKSNYGKPLPVYAWYPRYFSEGNPYTAVYILQEMSIICAGSLWVCVDTIDFGLLAQHNVMLKILSRRIADVGWTGSQNRGPDYNENNHQLLCECVKYHVEITNYQSETNEIYGSILFSKITFSVIIVCSFVYSLTLEGHDFGSLVCQLTIFGVIISTLFVLSWMSEQISATSDNLLNKAVECNFQCMDRRTTKTLFILMQGLSRTVHIEVGSVFQIVLSLNMFVNIMNFSYKCLALLKTIEV